LSTEKKISLRAALYGLIILASLLPAVVLAPWLASRAHDLLLDRAMLNEEIFHKAVDTSLYLETERLVSVLQNKSDPIAYFMSQGGSPDAISDLLEKINQRESMVNTTTIYDRHAHILFTNRQGEHTTAPINTASPAFAIPMHQRVFIGSPARLNDKHFEFLIAVPLVADGNSLGVMISTINIDDFWQQIKAKVPAHEAMSYLIDGRGTLLTRQENSQHRQGDLLSDLPIVRSLLARKDWHSSESYHGFEGTRVFGIGTTVRGLEWGVISEIPSASIMSPILSALTILTVIVVLLHALFGVIGLLFTRRLLGPISALATVMKRASHGDYTHVVNASTYQEIDDLSTSFNTMVREIGVREASLHKLLRAIEHLGESLVITNRHGIIEYVNPAFTLINGYSEDEVLGRSMNIINSGAQPKSFYEQLWQSILSGNTWEGRLTNRKKDGSLYPALMTIAPVNDGRETTHFVAVQQDMSAQNLLEEQLHQSQKMEALGTLVGGIAHDFNNMLAGMTGNLFLAKRRAANTPDLCQKLDNIEQLSLRAADMIRQLLTFARKGRVSMKPLALTPLIEKTVDFLRSSIPENIAIDQQLCHEPLQINGDETQLHQVLMNLLSNARDAVAAESEPTITITLDAFETDSAFMATNPTCRPGHYAHLCVSDNGMGIPAEQVEHLFEPFFTTKEQGKGTGLGLAMVFGAVKTHHGFIDVERSSGKGTAFHIYIPLLQQPAAPAPLPPALLAVVGNGETILLADDDSSVRQTTAEVLESMNYRILQAEDGVMGEALFSAHHQQIDLAILDEVMPHCGGAELAERIRKLNPELPMIFITGYDRESVLDETGRMQNCQVLSKPVQFDELSSAIRSVLKQG